jgi:hypothetical protein
MMRILTRPVTLAMALVAAAAACSPERAAAVESRHHPARIVVAPSPLLWCGAALPCDLYGWQRACARENLPGPCQVFLAHLDDEWCRDFGPPGSGVYVQCRKNRYYDRISAPLRAIK